MDWFRMYNEITRDNKLRRLPVAQRWLWVAVLCLARRSPVPGHLLLSPNVPVTLDDLADEAKVEIEDVERAFAYYQDKEMIHLDDGVYVVTHWHDRQFESDDSTRRVKEWREKRNVAQPTLGDDDETLQQRCDNGDAILPDTDTETDTEVHDESCFPEPIEVEPSEVKQAKPKSHEYSENSEPYKLAALLRDRILVNHPKARVPKTVDDVQPWCKHIELMIRVDNRAPPEIRTMILWCQNQDFWRAVILSTKKLREKYDQLYLQMARKNGRKEPSANGDKAADPDSDRARRKALYAKAGRLANPPPLPEMRET